MSDGRIREWKDMVMLDLIGVEGKTLQEAIVEYADEAELHDVSDEICTCVYCQTLAPMARKLDNRIVELEQRLAEYRAINQQATATLERYLAKFGPLS